MMEAAGSAISKKMTKSFALDQAPLVEVAEDERQGLLTKTHFTLGIAVGWDCSPGNLLKESCRQNYVVNVYSLMTKSPGPGGSR